MIVWAKEECLKMTFESLKGKINVLEVVRQRVPGCRTGVGKRPSPVHGQIDMEGEYSSPRPAERRWRRPATPDTGRQSADRYSNERITMTTSGSSSSSSSSLTHSLSVARSSSLQNTYHLPSCHVTITTAKY